MSRPRPARRPRADDGTVLLLIVCYFLVVAALLIVVIDSAAVFLARRELAGLSDGAALAASQAVDEASVYGRPLGADLPLSQAGVSQAVAAYLADRAGNYPGLTVDSVVTNGSTVTVTLSDRKSLPLLGPLAAAVPGGVLRITATASARSPLG